MSWTAAIPILNKILDVAIKAWRRYKRRRDYAKRQKQAKKIAADPARAMSDHFPGDDRVRNSGGGDDKDDAGEADETDDNSSRDQGWRHPSE